MAIDRIIPEDAKKRIERQYTKYKICKKCGKRNPEGAMSCRTCGYSKPEHSKSKWYRRKAQEPRG